MFTYYSLSMCGSQYVDFDVMFVLFILQRVTFQLVVISDGVAPSYAIYNYGDEMTTFTLGTLVGVSFIELMINNCLSQY